MALLAAELATVHAVYCVRCGTTIVQANPTPPVQRTCAAPGAEALPCQFVRLRGAEWLDDASAQRLLYAIRAAKRRGQLGHAQDASHVRARAATLLWEVRALALQCTVATDHEALQRASAALGEVLVRNGGRVLPDAPVAAAPAHTPEAAAHVVGTGAQEHEGGPLRWMLSALGGGGVD